ncbi:transposase, partial [Salmonella enterica]|nr:transposase [Salmonella enterica]
MEFTVTKYVKEHQCSTVRESADHVACSSSFVANYIEEQFVSNNQYKPSMIIADIKARFGVTISYRKAYLAREKAMKKVVGDYEQAYRDLPLYLRELRVRDPETYVALQRDGNNQFQRCFWGFGACRRVFRSYIRKLIGIDATHLRGKYPGVMLMATTIDDNDNVLPVGFGIAEVECASAWEWFLDHTKIFFAVDAESLTIVSDRHRDIISAVRKVYPTAHHAFCCYHMSCSMVTDTGSRSALGLFWAAARA